MKFLIALVITISIGCNPGQRTEFRYKEISESDFIDTLSNKDISDFYGVWTIEEIAKIGGSIRSEEEIQSQIGNKLTIGQDQIVLELWGENIIKNPRYEVQVEDQDSADLKGTALGWGYRPCRENLIHLVAFGKEPESLYFEVIHYQELIHYFDGRLFFLRRH